MSNTIHFIKCSSGRWIGWYDHKDNVIANGETMSECEVNLIKLYASVMQYEQAEKTDTVVVGIEEAGIAAVKISEQLNPKLTSREEAIFIAGFQECIKWQKSKTDTVVEDRPQIMAESGKGFLSIWIEKPLSGEIKINGTKVYLQSEVDAIREETWQQCRCFVDGCAPFESVMPFFKYKTLQDYLNSLNPDNKAYTGKEEKMSNKKIEIQSILNTFKNFDGTQTYEIKVTDLFPPNSGEKIKDAIESVINNVDDLTVQDYKDVIDDHKRLVKELDIIINGRNAAESPSLCDLVSQLKQPTNDTGKDSRVDWEIMSFVVKNLDGFNGQILPKINGYFGVKEFYVTEEDLLKSSIHDIHSVKRLSDNTVFSVGDVINWLGTIDSIDIDSKYDGGVVFNCGDRKQSINGAKKHKIVSSIEVEIAPEKIVTDNTNVQILTLKDLKCILQEHSDGTYRGIENWTFPDNTMPENLYQPALQLVTKKLKTHTP